MILSIIAAPLPYFPYALGGKPFLIVVEMHCHVELVHQTRDNGGITKNRETVMTDTEREQLAALIRTARQAKGLSARELARRAGVDAGTVTRLERCEIGEPQVGSVRAMAQVLGIPLADVYALLHWLPATELPTLRPYMRAKYADLPDAAVTEVEDFIADLSKRYKTGPIDHEDEA